MNPWRGISRRNITRNEMSDEPDIHELIERGSLGTPEAKAIRATVSREDVERVLAMARNYAARLDAIRLNPEQWPDYCPRCGVEDTRPGEEHDAEFHPK